MLDGNAAGPGVHDASTDRLADARAKGDGFTGDSRSSSISMDAGTLVDARSMFKACDPHTPCRIMPLGDSITFGFENGQAEPGNSYRPELLRLATEAGYVIDFVGSVASGTPSQQNEGHPGQRIDEISDSVVDYLNLNPADIVILIIGTNDIIQGYDLATAPDRLGTLIDKITMTLPSTLTVVGSIPKSSDATWNVAAASYSASVPGVVQGRAALGQRVLFADIYDQLNATTDLSDPVHPSDAGYAKIAGILSALIFP